MTLADRNPFCTRRVQPGAMPFRFAGPDTFASLVDRLRENGWRGQIVGPHGSGKSTLVRGLQTELQRVGRTVALFALQAGEHRLPPNSRAGWDSTTQVIVDGYEQLSRWERWRIRWRCRRTGAGLLVTTHRPVGLPTLCELHPDLPTVQQLVAALQVGFEPRITPEQVAAAWREHAPDVRETLFRLYDAYERAASRSQQEWES